MKWLLLFFCLSSSSMGFLRAGTQSALLISENPGPTRVWEVADSAGVLHVSQVALGPFIEFGVPLP